MADVLLDLELRGRLDRLGIQRAAHFNWPKTLTGRSRPLPVRSRVQEASKVDFIPR